MKTTMAILALAVAMTSTASAAEDARVRLDKAIAAKSEADLVDFLGTSPPPELVVEARRAICVLRMPKPDESSTPSRNEREARVNLVTLEMQHLFADGCDHARSVRDELSKALLEYAAASGASAQHRMNAEQSAGASITRIAGMLRATTLEGMETSLGPTRMTIEISKKNPLKLRLAKMDMYTGFTQAQPIVGFDDEVYSAGLVEIDMSNVEMNANAPPRPKPSPGSAPPKYVATEVASLIVKNGSPTVIGAYVVNGARIYCLAGGVTFESREAAPLFEEGTRCLFNEREVVYRNGKWN